MTETKQPQMYHVLLTMTKLLTIAGILTFIPWKWASFPNVIGYRSLCTFAPAATLFCFFLAGSVCFIRAVFVKNAEGSAAERFPKHVPSLIPLIILLTLAIGSSVWFYSVKSRYSDSVTGASVLAE